jgi:heme-degrading monooxygenase HmoA
MINRIVRMSFRPEEVENFLKVFEASKDKIAGFEGCEGLNLLRDSKQTNVLFTYSYWRDEICLNHYRYSELFKETWAKTKVLFNDKPEAWSLDLLDKVK